MGRKKSESRTNLLVGVVAIFALCGIGYLLIVYGFDSTPSSYTPRTEHRIDTIKTLPVIEFKNDSIKVESDSIPDPIIE